MKLRNCLELHERKPHGRKLLFEEEMRNIEKNPVAIGSFLLFPFIFLFFSWLVASDREKIFSLSGLSPPPLTADNSLIKVNDSRRPSRGPAIYLRHIKTQDELSRCRRPLLRTPTPANNQRVGRNRIFSVNLNLVISL